MNSTKSESVITMFMRASSVRNSSCEMLPLLSSSTERNSRVIFQPFAASRSPKVLVTILGVQCVIMTDDPAHERRERRSFHLGCARLEDRSPLQVCNDLGAEAQNQPRHQGRDLPPPVAVGSEAEAAPICVFPR